MKDLSENMISNLKREADFFQLPNMIEDAKDAPPQGDSEETKEQEANQERRDQERRDQERCDQERRDQERRDQERRDQERRDQEYNNYNKTRISALYGGGAP